ncbi:MAG TPA: hypothetical protein VK493_15085, partial [Bryobacteraceae bacterium]|nr:hypothetical protein [Bryobacteraceae bacterium]
RNPMNRRDHDRSVLVLAAAATYLWEKVSKAIQEWQAERNEMRRFEARMREWERERQVDELSRRRCDYAFARYNDRLAAGDSPLKASGAFDVATAWAEKNIS